jgi:hypothetical protein
MVGSRWCGAGALAREKSIDHFGPDAASSAS